MKALLWCGVLSAIVFGIGWKSSQLSAAGTSPPPPPGRDGGFGGERHGHGPFFGPSLDFAQDLGLDDAQRERVAKIVEASAAAIDAHEKAMREIKAQARTDLLAVLTDAQRQKMEELTEQAFQRHAAEIVQSGVDWFRRNAQLDDGGIRKVESILTDYETAKRRYLRPSCSDGAQGPDPVDPIRELRTQRDARLAEVVDAATLEKFASERPGFRRHPGRD